MQAEQGETDKAHYPKHIAIIMDGNGRWAQKRHLPRIMGHPAGVKAVKRVVKFCAEQEIQVLTLFAFSSENWRRPKEEVSKLMGLFMLTMQKEVKRLNKNNIRLRFIGERTDFAEKIQQKMTESERLTEKNTGLTLVIAANYGGHRDMALAMQSIAQQVKEGKVEPEEIDEAMIGNALSIPDLPDPDLFIRTGGEKRISNFLLWQLAYTEFHFTSKLWPDFDAQTMQDAIDGFLTRERRYGRTSEQVQSMSN
ncbi:undecaprenyl diphosphate synthase [Bathymodiolus platifrons methanotrophic gill symbiont]|uniref:isoprenyl transferase n=1 Tax=Bathymodiolus platifrons methanotrophic gill symbiont TaxID=113268 RepID=UPI0011CC5B26|nr:isoprenyl transferase [Bathymodiolus platifrons methanotrophic gill symbiont]TXK99320.1 di-trans,poly-cis-decaprenylcistransferase [Methylococcaceae bacterium HT1]TXL16858.1 di-trans,poly-cis-decaprenylcistransferase [Methylococcaceae bacterium HT3]TXL23340.1 di-trans,poly-cis-decaprenylcistransferase [Methylococcaceae bacterium HT2]GFO74487.1 undecaprenyl diphosphate synthase [Bathymodiolus platifrons methanotrophic gill symbiont]